MIESGDAEYNQVHCYISYVFSLLGKSTLKVFRGVYSNCFPHSQHGESTCRDPGGVDLPDVDPEYEGLKPLTNTYIRSFFRVFVFSAVYGPRVFTEPVSTVAVMLGGRLKQGDPDQEQVVFTKLEKYPVFEKYRPLTPDGTRLPLFDGFFEWLYAQDEPDEFLTLPSSFQDDELEE